MTPHTLLPEVLPEPKTQGNTIAPRDRAQARLAHLQQAKDSGSQPPPAQLRAPGEADDGKWQGQRRA